MDKRILQKDISLKCVTFALVCVACYISHPADFGFTDRVKFLLACARDACVSEQIRFPRVFSLAANVLDVHRNRSDHFSFRLLLHNFFRVMPNCQDNFQAWNTGTKIEQASTCLFLLCGVVISASQVYFLLFTGSHMWDCNSKVT